jgi:hypothetical protein
MGAILAPVMGTLPIVLALCVDGPTLLICPNSAPASSFAGHPGPGRIITELAGDAS